MKRGLKISFLKSKKAQQTMGLPFGLIFSIFLIAVFVVAAIWAVTHFLDIGKCSEIGLFYDELQNKVDEAWASQTSEFNFKIDLPSGIKKICFGNLTSEITNQEDFSEIEIYYLEEANVFLVPSGEACNIPYYNLKHINISEITKLENPYCVDLEKRNEIKIKKDFYDKNVLIE